MEIMSLSFQHIPKKTEYWGINLSKKVKDLKKEKFELLQGKIKTVKNGKTTMLMDW